MRILCLLFYCMACSISASAITAYADTTICDTIITSNPIDTILARTIIEQGGFTYYIPCGEAGEKYITLRNVNVVGVRPAPRSDIQYVEEQRVASKKIKQVALLTFAAFSLILVGAFVWYPLILVGFVCMIPQVIFSYYTHRSVNQKYYLRKERKLARRLYVLPIIGSVVLAGIAYIILLFNL